MNMRARFGMGLFAGLLLGFLIVGSTALYSPSQTAAPAALMASHAPAYQVSNPTATSSVSSVTTAAATMTVMAGAGAANSSLGTLQSSLGTLRNTPNVTDYYGVSNAQGNNSAERAVLASEIDSIPRQPLVISLAVFLPVVAAVLFGAVFYRLSMSRQEDEASPAA